MRSALLTALVGLLAILFALWLVSAISHIYATHSGSLDSVSAIIQEQP